MASAWDGPEPGGPGAQGGDPTGTPTAPGTCFGKKVTIAGTAGPDVLVGTFGTDVVPSFAGNDVVRGDADFGGFPGGDADDICLGEGDDVVTEQLDGGRDTVDAGPGTDRCVVDTIDVVTNCETVIRVPAGG